MKEEISISTSTILKVIGILLLLGFAYLVRDIIVLMLFAVILVLIIEPMAARMEKKKIPRMVSVIIIYLFGIAILSLVLFLLIPPVAQQMKQLAANLPNIGKKIGNEFEIIKQFALKYNFNIDLAKISSELDIRKFLPNIFSTTKAFFGGVISIIIILATSFYMAVEKGGLEKFIDTLTPQKHRDKVLRLFKKSQAKLIRWAQGQLLVMLIIGLLDYLGLVFMGVKFALLLGVLGAVLEIVPYAGPIIATIFAITIGLSQSLTAGLIAGLWFLIVQQLENHVITPKVMQSAIGLNPVIVILSVLVGTKFFGILGFILAVPLAAVVEAVVSDLLRP